MHPADSRRLRRAAPLAPGSTGGAASGTPASAPCPQRARPALQGTVGQQRTVLRYHEWFATMHRTVCAAGDLNVTGAPHRLAFQVGIMRDTQTPPRHSKVVFRATCPSCQISTVTPKHVMRARGSRGRPSLPTSNAAESWKPGCRKRDSVGTTHLSALHSFSVPG